MTTNNPIIILLKILAHIVRYHQTIPNLIKSNQPDSIEAASLDPT